MATRGLVLLAKDTFSGVSSVSFDDVFSNTYKQYKIIIHMSSPTGAYAYMRMRAGGSDNSSGNYMRTYFSASSTTVSCARAQSQTRIDGVAELNTYENINYLEILNPYQSTYTIITVGNNDTSAGNLILRKLVAGLNVTTSYDGFTIAPDSSTITGTITVYGLAE